MHSRAVGLAIDAAITADQVEAALETAIAEMYDPTFCKIDQS